MLAEERRDSVYPVNVEYLRALIGVGVGAVRLNCIVGVGFRFGSRFLIFSGPFERTSLKERILCTPKDVEIVFTHTGSSRRGTKFAFPASLESHKMLI